MQLILSLLRLCVCVQYLRPMCDDFADYDRATFIDATVGLCALSCSRFTNRIHSYAAQTQAPKVCKEEGQASTIQMLTEIQWRSKVGAELCARISKGLLSSRRRVRLRTLPQSNGPACTAHFSVLNSPYCIWRLGSARSRWRTYRVRLGEVAGKGEVPGGPQS